MVMGQRQDMPEALQQEFESLAATWFHDYLNYQDKGFTLELLADEVVGCRTFRSQINFDVPVSGRYRGIV